MKNDEYPVKIQYLIAAGFVCVLLFFYAVYTSFDDYRADQELINKCNEHWREQVEVVCPLLFEREGFFEFNGSLIMGMKNNWSVET